MTTARILGAFWNRSQNRACQLLGHEVEYRSGFNATSKDCRDLIERGLIKVNNGTYSLTREGEARVSELVIMGTLPKPVHRLTAIPPDKRR